MAYTPRLDLRQGQNLVITPQLQQAIKLLQLSNLELSDFVEKELEQNPMLEREDAGGPERGDGSNQKFQDEDGVLGENGSALETGSGPETAANSADSEIGRAHV